MAERSAVSEAAFIIARSKQPLLIIGKGSTLSWCFELYKLGTDDQSDLFSPWVLALFLMLYLNKQTSENRTNFLKKLC